VRLPRAIIGNPPSSVNLAGRSIKQLAREFDPTENCIRNWIKQADIDNGRRSDGLTSEERAELVQLRREVRILGEEKEILKKSRGLVCTGDRHDAVATFEFVKGYQAMHGIATMCRVLGVSTSGYWAWGKRSILKREKANRELEIEIGEIHRW
jgi:hypothetical protein